MKKSHDLLSFRAQAGAAHVASRHVERGGIMLEEHLKSARQQQSRDSTVEHSHTMRLTPASWKRPQINAARNILTQYHK